MDLPGPLVAPEWLVEGLGAPGLVVADVRWMPGGSVLERFAAGHIPGAVSLDLETDLSSPPFEGGTGRHPLPPPAVFAGTMGRVGIGDDDAVVAYDDAGGSVAARLWWMLDATGHRAAVLDGGLGAWPGEVETGPPPTRAPASFTARPWPGHLVVDADQVAAAIADGSSAVIDARAPERYRGETEPFDPVAGHIPGARSAPWEGNLDPGTGRFLDPERLRERFAAIGVTEGTPTICYCGSGTTTCHDILAVRIAGLGAARLYAGSWSDWCSDPSRPVATGEEP